MKEDIIIKKLKGGGFDVWVGDKHTECLTHEEMLGVVIALTINDKINDLHKRWLKTDEEHEKEREFFSKQSKKYEIPM